MDAAIRRSLSKKPISHAKSAPVSGWLTTVVAVNRKSAMTTMRTTAVMIAGFAGLMREQHKERDADASSEQGCRSDDVQIFERPGDKHQRSSRIARATALSSSTGQILSMGQAGRSKAAEPARFEHSIDQR